MLFQTLPIKFYLQTFLFFVDKSLTLSILIYTTPHTISTSIVTLILLFSTLLTLFLPFLSKLQKFSNAVNLTIVSNFLDIAPSNTPHVMYKETYLLAEFLLFDILLPSYLYLLP